MSAHAHAQFVEPAANPPSFGQHPGSSFGGPLSGDRSPVQPGAVLPSAASLTAAAPKAEPQKVMMTKTELELYVRDGRPTGLLFRSVAALKGLTGETISKAAGIPAGLVQSMFEDHGVASIKRSSIKRVAQVLGIDLTTMRFSDDQVHVFDLGRLPGRMKGKAAMQAVRAVGLLARGARVAELGVGKGLQAWNWRNRMHVVQKDSFRALFIGSRTKQFSLGFIPSAQWVCDKRSESIVPVTNRELIGGLMLRDLTAGEFGELFEGVRALCWDDIRVASRVNGVSKRDLMNFIESKATELDTTEVAQAQTAVMENRQNLRLVETERAA